MGYQGPELVQQTNELVKKIQQRLLTAQSRQKGYTDKRHRPLAFDLDNQVLFESISLEGNTIGPLKIDGKVESVAYRLEFQSQLAKVHPVFHVSMLRK